MSIDKNRNFKVSIAIPTRNQANYIRDTLASAFTQTQPVSEIIVCDDASTDNTLAVVEVFRAELPVNERKKLKYHCNPVALKIGGNFAKAISLCSGEYIVKVDSDDILAPDFVKDLCQGMELYPEAGWAHCNVMKITDNKVPIRLAHARKNSGYISAPELARLYMYRSDTCHCVMLRADAYNQSGGYRPQMLTTEDRLLWIEMIMAGYGCYYSDQPLAQMREFTGRETMSKRRQDYIESIRFMQKHLEAEWDDIVSRRLGLSKSEALHILRTSFYRTCLHSSLLEKEEFTRNLLLEEARNFAKGPVAHLQLYLYQRVPQEIMQYLTGLLSAPRRLLRSIYMKFDRK